MEILLTGSNGFLGKHLKKKLNNYLYIELNSKKKTLDNSYVYDLSKEIPQFACQPEMVIHAAGLAHTNPKNLLEAKSFFDVNVNGTKNLLLGLKKSGIPKRFVFISSVAVYGLDSGLLINEDYPLLAKDPYGLSKIQAERLVLEWCKKNNVICTILRLPLLVGKNPPGNLGAMVKAIKKRYYFNIGGGVAKKSMVIADEVASFIPEIAEVGGIYNLTDGFHPTFYELSRSISNKQQLNMPILLAKFIGYIGDILGDIAPINSSKIKKITSDLTFDDSKARELGWNPQTVLNYLKNNEL